MRYDSFQISISDGPAGYTVHASSLVGKATSLVPLLSRRKVEIALGTLWDESPPVRHLEVVDSKSEKSSEIIFQDLFESLFGEKIVSLYRESFDRIAAPDVGLRTEITLDSRSPQSAVLQMLPWELLRLSGTPTYLAMQRRSPVVRTLATQQPRQETARPRRLRILAVAPRESSLDLDREMRNLRETVGSVPDLELVIPEAPTLEATRKALLEAGGGCHVLHFMGHGSVLPESGERVLIFESEHGGDEPVSGTDLLNKIGDFTSLQLVVLNACGSAAGAPVSPNFDPFAYVASTLVLGGISAVVAMQSHISDGAAITFSRAFYERFAAGDSVEEAVTEGRQSMHSQATSSIEWASPALFMQAGIGDIFSRDGTLGAQMHQPEVNLCGRWTGSWKNIVKKTNGAETVHVSSHKNGIVKGFFYDPLNPSIKMEFTGHFQGKSLFVRYCGQNVMQEGSCSLELQSDDGSLKGYYSDFSGCGTYELKLDQLRESTPIHAP
jgi:CHAT domain